jgi:uncharacterized Ntn-hydrolase superfamily protein
MSRTLVALALLLATPVARGAEDLVLHTFSICARDPKTGELGVAVTTRLPDVGRLCPFVKTGVGAVATQSYVKVEYGPQGLALLEQGKSPQETLDEMLRDDPMKEKRQLGIVDAQGRTATFTGKECIDHASDRSGPNYTVQGNLLVGRETIDAVADAFEASDGLNLELADRLIAALEAGQRAGGDKRKGGLQSAAVRVAHPEKTHYDGSHLIVDLQVAEHPEPVAELRRQHDTIRRKLGHRTFRLLEGPDIRELKTRLHQLGHFRADAKPDDLASYLATREGGLYDPEAAAAVDAFRKASGLAAPADGFGQPRGVVDAPFLDALDHAWRAWKKAHPDAPTPPTGDPDDDE